MLTRWAHRCKQRGAGDHSPILDLLCGFAFIGQQFLKVGNIFGLHIDGFLRHLPVHRIVSFLQYDLLHGQRAFVVLDHDAVRGLAGVRADGCHHFVVHALLGNQIRV